MRRKPPVTTPALLFLLVLAAVLPGPSKAAEETTYGSVQIDRVVSVYDGDTFRADIRGWPDIVGRAVQVRVSGMDTPEIRGECAAEKQRAVTARNRARQLLMGGQPVVLTAIRRGKYFRILADVWIGNRLLSDILISEGLARPYEGGKRRGWC